MITRGMLWMLSTLLVITVIHVVRLLDTSIPECYNVKAFALDELTRRCLVHFRRTPESSYSIVSGRTIDELQARAQCAMPSFVGTGRWSTVVFPKQT